MKPLSMILGFALLLALNPGVLQAQTAAPGAAPLTAAQLDKLLAPIALYPDALVIQIVQCSTSPYQVKQVDAWLKQNPDLKGTAAQDAATKQGFDANFVAIVLFPQVLDTMAKQPDWTQGLGHAFATQRDGVLESVQRLRKQAQSVGNLKTTEQQEVQTVNADGGTTVIVIQPANPQVVYVPQYDPQVIYTQPAPAPAASSSSDNAEKVMIGVISFAAGVIVGAAADNDDHHFYYASGGWGYARPICYPGGYNSYYQHRENMANDYYRHRENMANDWYDNRQDLAGQRGDNQGQRQDTRTTSQTSRQDTRTTSQDSRASTQASRQDTRTTNQAQRQTSVSQSQARTTATTSRGTFQGSAQTSTRTTRQQSSTFSGYQRGSTERQASERGRSSVSRSDSSGRSSGTTRSSGRGRG